MTSTDLAPTPTPMSTDLIAVEQFLYAEVDLLDRREFEAWLELFTDECTYWIPAGVDDLDPTRRVSIVYDDRKLLTERIWRFGSGLAYAQQPRSRTAHLVSNVQIVGHDEATGTEPEILHVHAKFLISEFRRDALLAHSGRYVYRLAKTGDGLRIRSKKVELINNDGRLGNLSLPM